MAYLWAQKMSVLSLPRHVGTAPRGAFTLLFWGDSEFPLQQP